MNFELIIQYAIIVAVLLIIALVIVKLNHKDFNMDVNKLVKCLGGKDNILDSETTMSRFKVTLKDVSLADKEGLTKLGAQGIVEIDNQLKIILGPNSKQLKRYIKEIRK